LGFVVPAIGSPALAHSLDPIPTPTGAGSAGEIGETLQLRASDLVFTCQTMALLPPLDKATDRSATQQGLLIVSPRGRIQFATPRAALWLKDFLLSPSDRLPQAVAGWLEDALSPGQPTRFIIDRRESRLCIQLLCREPNAICLLLEQTSEIAAPSGARAALTERQIEVLSWVARGKTNAEIAQILSLKTGTIGKYLERIFPKLGVENRTAAASFIMHQSASA